MNEEGLLMQILNYATLVMMANANARFAPDEQPSQVAMVALAHETAAQVNEELGLGSLGQMLNDYLVAVVMQARVIMREKAKPHPLTGVQRLLMYAAVKLSCDAHEEFGECADPLYGEMLDLAQEVGLEIGETWPVPRVGCWIVQYLTGVIQECESVMWQQGREYSQ